MIEPVDPFEGGELEDLDVSPWPVPVDLGVSFYHMALGLQVVIEDYVHSGMKYVAVIAVRLVCLALGSAGIMAILSIAFGN